MSSAAQPTPPENHVHLVLLQQQPDPFYLEIPLGVITDVCRHPPKYLCYLGWCVLGAEGSLQDEAGNHVDLDGDLVDQSIYYYRLPVAEQDVLLHAVDLEVIKLRSQVPSQTSRTRGSFREDLAKRDGERCVWTGFHRGAGMHIIPWSKGDEWLQLIIANRPRGGEQGLRTLKSINDIRNGIIGIPFPHHSYFDSRDAVILKTPNLILRTNDVPGPHNRNLHDGYSYSPQARYTFQWLFTDDPELLHSFPNNADAAFVSHDKPKPSDLLLHYSYGAAAVTKWGRNHAILNSRPGLPRPTTVTLSPTKSIDNRQITTAELVAARDKEVQLQPAGNEGGMDSTKSEQPVWDEDDVMLFFWGNSIPSMERHAEKERERKETIEKWRIGV
ncbi:hypothetical protein HD554DRAFT_2314559 [Boletus coccyginus]|nr:hypothetical protein HD554DRAFT_2314559 [Boletus coccyginus]